VINTKNRKRICLQTLTANIFARIAYKTKFSNKKGNRSLLPIDILKEVIKKDLLEITTNKVEKSYLALMAHHSPFSNMRINGEVIFLELIKEICDAFLTKQYGCEVKLDSGKFKNSLYVKDLLGDIEILFQVPFYALLNPKSSEFLLIYYPIYRFASENFLEALLDNLIIEIANCVVYVGIINFSFLYSFRQTLYRSKFLSLRNFERFKNNLVWQLKIKIYIQKPTLFYSSCYSLFLLRTNGIYIKTIYANRSQYIASLTNFPLLTVAFIEFKDFIVSRFDEVLYYLSSVLRFTLSSVLGQFIGLVWRGIIEGLKNKNVNQRP